MQTYNQFKSESHKKKYENYLLEAEKRWPIESNAIYVQTPFGKTFVRVSGSGSPLVLLPGTQCSSLNYASIVEELSQHYKVYAVDIIGDFGHSYLDRKIESEEDYINWQKSLYDGLGLKDNLSILGVSMGAWLGGLYASTYKIKNLILISPVRLAADISNYSKVTGLLSILLPFSKKIIMKQFFSDFLEKDSSHLDQFEKDIMGPIKVSHQCLKFLKPVVPPTFY